MLGDVFEQIGEQLRELPKEVGTEVVAQVKGKKQDDNQKKSGSSNSGSSISDDQNQQQYLQDLYGSSELTPEQTEMKNKQEGKIKINNYKKIQQEIQEYRAKKAQEKTNYEKGMQKGTKAAQTQEEEMELWEKEQKKAEEKKKKQEAISMPGSAQSKSGEQGTVMG
jgi:hypothetical protein